MGSGVMESRGAGVDPSEDGQIGTGGSAARTQRGRSPSTGGDREQARERATADLPKILYVADMAQRFGTTPQGVRNRVHRGTLPRPRKSGKPGGRSFWTREDVLKWEAESARVSERAETPVKITARPRTDRPGSMQVTFELPPVNGQRNRPRRNAPAGLNEQQAIAWGHSILGDILREHMHAPPPVQQREESAHNTPQMPAAVPVRVKRSAPAKRKVPTLSEFWHGEFQNYIERQAWGTQVSFRSIWKNYLEPALGSYPMDSIGKEEIRVLNTSLKGMKKASARNQARGKLRQMFEVACDPDLEILELADVPHIKNEKEEPREPPPRYDEEEIVKVIQAAANMGPDTLAMLLLMMDTDLRVSEVCALRWKDIDYKQGIITVRHNYSRGKPSLPKGKKAKPVGLTPALEAALKQCPRVPEVDDHVLVREYLGQICRLTPAAITRRLEKLAENAGVAAYSPHKIRHTGGTQKARNGAPGWVVQAALRHARLSTTQIYIDLDGPETARTAARYAASTLLDTKPAATKRTPRAPKPRNAA